MLAEPLPDADQLRKIISPGEDAGEYCRVVIPLGNMGVLQLMHSRVRGSLQEVYPETRSRHPSR